VSGSLANRDIVADGEPMKRFEDEFPTEWSLSPDGPDRELGQPPADNKEVNTVEQPVKPLILAAGASGQPAW
jgi:hypothetical protein